MTDSELAVVQLVASGLTNKEVAERLYISPYTVGGHLRHAFEKPGINSRVALTRITAEHASQSVLTGQRRPGRAAASSLCPHRCGSRSSRHLRDRYGARPAG